MLQKFTPKKISLAILVLLISIQFFRISKSNPPVEKEKDFLVMSAGSIEIQNIIKTSCYDCHSNTSAYPWYTNFAPVSWWIKHHINDGREHLNFSEWGNYNAKKADHKLEECIEMIEEGEMPLHSYTFIHNESKLSPEQKLSLINWFNDLRNSEIPVNE